MTRSLFSFTMFLSFALASASASAQQSCACPAMVPPVPGCDAPSCVAPTYQGCAENCICSQSSGCGSKASCCNHDQNCSSGKCCRPLIYIDLSKRIVKKNGYGGNAMFGGAPPQGFAVTSMPVLPLNISAMPVSFNGASSAGMNNTDLNNLMAAAAALNNIKTQQAAAASAAASSGLECKDPCGDIKQLQNDVAQIKEITRNLAAAVEELANQK